MDNDDQNRSVVDLKVSYTSGVHTKGRKKGQEKIEEEIITIIVPFLDPLKAQGYIEEYCRKKNMQLISWNIQPLPGKRLFEFDCQYCEYHSINLNPMNQKFCSNYCRRKKESSLL